MGYHAEQYPEDIELLQSVATKNGLSLTNDQLETIWERHSDDYCASWLIVSNDEDFILKIINEYKDE